MALVTVTLLDVGTSPIGPDAVGTVVFTLDRPVIALDGVHAQERIEAPTAVDGTATVDLIPYSQMLEPSPYRLSVEWQNPDGYGSTGFTAISHYPKPIYVPDGGGSVQSFTTPTAFAGFITGYGPPSSAILAGSTPYIDVSGEKPYLYA